MRIEAVIFDWAGTVIDFGSRAPMAAFVETFATFGVSISIADARGPMGRAKLDHIEQIGRLPHVSEQWQQQQGGPFDAAAAQAVYESFLPRNREIVTDYATLIPGVADVAQWLSQRQIRIGSTTGYTRDIMERLLPLAAQQGFQAASLVCAGDTPTGRPTAAMMYQSFLHLGVDQCRHVIKVDDTQVGIEEGRRAGCMTVAVTATGNSMGLSEAEFAALSPAERYLRLREVRRIAASWQPDFILDSVADLPDLISRLACFHDVASP